MKQFTRSMYASEAELYFDKAQYYQRLFFRVMEHLVQSEDFRYDEEDDNYYCVHSGDIIDEGL